MENVTANKGRTAVQVELVIAFQTHKKMGRRKERETKETRPIMNRW